MAKLIESGLKRADRKIAGEMLGLRGVRWVESTLGKCVNISSPGRYFHHQSIFIVKVLDIMVSVRGGGGLPS